MDKRVQGKRAGRDLSALFERAMSGEEARGAEGHGLRIIGQLAQLYLMGEGELAEALRGFVLAIQDKADPLRRDIPPEIWAALWPTLNTLASARRTMEEATRGRQQGEGEGAEPRRASGGEQPGAGVLRPDSRGGVR